MLSWFKNRSIFTIYSWGMAIIFLFVVLFTILVIHNEYIDFERKAKILRHDYIVEQKQSVKFDVNRVLNYINSAYNTWHNKIDEDKLKKQIITTIEQLYGRRDGTGYIFIYDFNGTNLSDPLHKINIGKNLINYKDSGGIKVIKELIDVSKREDGGYVEYRWIHPVSKKEEPKISYAKAFLPWGWMVGTGFYVNDVNRIIAKKKKRLQELLIKYILEMLTLGVIFLGIGFLIIYVLNSIVKNELNVLERFFEQASKRHILIDKERLYLKEFRGLVKYINSMVKSIQIREQNLKEANLTLEKRVEKKTKDLQEYTKLLENEKKFSDSLLEAQDKFIRASIHEVNTPLAIIMAQIDILKIKFEDNRYINKIEAATKMISYIYDDLSYIIKKDIVEYKKEWIELSSFIIKRVAFFNDLARLNKKSFKLNIQKGVNIYFSEVKLQRVIDNNLSNAIKYAKRDTKIEVSLKADSKFAYFCIKTISTPIKDKAKIFNAFAREDSIKGGFGLGLDIVKSICDSEGIEINLESNSKFTKFTYRFKL